MRKAVFMIMVGALAFSMTSCKKGANDPALSLKSRKARLAGEWTLKEGEVVNIYTSSGTSTTYTTTFTGSNQTYSDGSSSTTTPYTLTWEFDKKGKYNSTEVDDGDTYTEEGFWQFLGKSKSAEKKNKEAISIYARTTVSGGTTSNYEGKSNLSDVVYTLDKLSSKELVILYDFKIIDSSGDTDDYKGTMTFEKK